MIVIYIVFFGFLYNFLVLLCWVGNLFVKGILVVVIIFMVGLIVVVIVVVGIVLVVFVLILCLFGLKDDVLQICYQENVDNGIIILEVKKILCGWIVEQDQVFFFLCVFLMNSVCVGQVNLSLCFCNL